MRCIRSVVAGVTAIMIGSGCRDVEKAASSSEITLTAVECGACAIVLDTIATITEAPSDAISFITLPVVDSRGRTIIANAKENGLLLFDSTGAQIAVWGKAGGGPGELGSIGTVALLPGDTVAVFDMSRQTLLFFHDRTFVREARTGDFDCCTTPLVLPEGGFLIGQDGGAAVALATDGTVSQPMQLISRDTTAGKHLCSACGMMVLGASSRRGVYWAAAVNEYLVQLVDATGTVVRSIARKAPWFETWTADQSREMGAAPPARLIALHESPDQILWTVVMVPRENKPAAAPPAPNEETELSGKEVGRMLDQRETRIEAIDLVSGKLLASRLFPGILVILQSGHAALLKIDAAGDPHWGIGRLRLTGFSRQKRDDVMKLGLR